jgi:dolichyl-phosphooligosaccharide-protein glycotransferase
MLFFYLVSFFTITFILAPCIFIFMDATADKDGPSKVVFRSPIFSFFKKHSTLFLLLIPLLLCLFLRLTPLYLPGLVVDAESQVDAYFETILAQSVLENNPALPLKNREALLQKELASLKKEGVIHYGGDELDYKGSLTGLLDSWKDALQDSDGLTYPLGGDSYYYLGQAENLVTNGFEHDIESDGSYYQTKALAGLPLSHRTPVREKVTNLHTLSLANSYKILRVFGVSFLQATFFLPIFFSLLSVLLLFFIARKIAGEIAGFFSALFLALHPLFLVRSLGGGLDTDVYAVFFPLLITLFFFFSLTSKTSPRRYSLITLSAFFTGLFAFTWTGWWFIFGFVVASYLFYILYSLYHFFSYFSKEDRALSSFFSSLKIPLYSFFCYVFSSALFVSLFKNFTFFFNALQEPFKFISLKEVAVQTIWPNVLSTVQELTSVSLFESFFRLGVESYIFISFAFIGIYVMFRSVVSCFKENEDSFVLVTSFFVFLWLIVGFYSVTQGSRFFLFVIPPFSLFFGFGVVFFISFSTRYLSNIFSSWKKFIPFLLVFLVLLSFISPFFFSFSKAEIMPTYDDVWWESLNTIKAGSNENAIITSWWDFGHFFKFAADRAVTFDGGSQNTPMAHWVGKVLLTSNEKEAVGLLRMMDCGSYVGYDLLKEYYQDDLKAVRLLDRLYLQTRSQAKVLLQEKGFEDNLIEEVLQYTHCLPPEGFLITSGDMLRKSQAWSHFGGWDFEKANVAALAKIHDKGGVLSALQENGYSLVEAEELYGGYAALSDDNAVQSWMGPDLAYFSSLRECQTVEREIVCSNGVVFSLDSQQLSIHGKERVIVPQTFAALSTKGDFVIAENPSEKISASTISASLIVNDGVFSSLIHDSALQSSMFNRLLFFDGVGLECFDLFDERSTVFGDKISVWKVNWTCLE